MRAFKTAKARSDTPMRGRATQTALKTFHLWTHLAGGRAEAAMCVATWASVSDRRPKGVVGVCDCMSLPQLGKENLLAKPAPSLTRLLTVSCGSDSLSVAKLRQRLPGR